MFVVGIRLSLFVFTIVLVRSVIGRVSNSFYSSHWKKKRKKKKSNCKEEAFRYRYLIQTKFKSFCLYFSFLRDSLNIFFGLNKFFFYLYTNKLIIQLYKGFLNENTFYIVYIINLKLNKYHMFYLINNLL